MLFEPIPLEQRVQIGLALIQLKKYGVGVQQLTLACEFSSGMSKQDKWLLLAQQLKKLGYVEKARLCLNEAYLISLDTKILQSVIEVQRTNNVKVEPNEDELQLIQKIRKMEQLHQKEYYRSRITQLEEIEYISNQLILFSISNFLERQKIIDDCLLGRVFKVASKFPPWSFFSLLEEHKATLQSMIKEEEDIYFEINLTAPAKPLCKSLKALSRSQHKEKLVKICRLTVLHRFTQSIISFLNDDLERSSSIMREVLLLFEMLSMHFDMINKTRNEFIEQFGFNEVFMVCAIYAAQYALQRNHKTSREEIEHLQKVLNKCLDDSSVNLITNKQLAGHLFKMLGLVYQRLAVYNLRWIRSSPSMFENHQPVEVPDNLIKLNEENLDCMVTNLIWAATMKQNHDPELVRIYDQILWGMLLSGGVHVKCFWFFKFVRDYYKLENDISPLTLDCYQPRTCYHKESITERLVEYYCHGQFFLIENEAQKLLDHIYNIKDSFSSDEKSQMWDVTQENVFLAPHVFLHQDSFKCLMMDGYFSYAEFQSLQQHHLRPILRRLMRYPQEETTEEVSKSIHKSRDWIVLWIQQFKVFNGREIPEVISNFWYENIE
ncbi:hypothetical protein LJB42_002893 [Komagataella kurtzmanii]|nr:hypothetical protein LJB42_002893 [Komagataella kurtzmanii]